MGQKHGNVKVTAKITVFGTHNIVDGVTLSYERNSCRGGRRVVATFTFPKGGWRRVSEGHLHNGSSKGVNVPLGRLSKKDGDTSVRITVLAGSSPVYMNQLALADLLGMLRRTLRGKEAALFFSLSVGKREGEKGVTFTTLFCNGRRVEAPDRHPAEGGGEVEDGEGVEDSPGLGGEGQGLEESPGLGEESKGVEDSPGLGGDGQGLDECPGLDEKDEGMEDDPGLGGDGQGVDAIPDLGQYVQGQEEEGVLRQATPQHEGRYNEEVPASPYQHVATPSAHGAGGQGRGGLRNTLGVCATVVVFILMFYNAWVEWNTA